MVETIRTERNQFLSKITAERLAHNPNLWGFLAGRIDIVDINSKFEWGVSGFGRAPEIIKTEGAGGVFFMMCFTNDCRHIKARHQFGNCF